MKFRTVRFSNFRLLRDLELRFSTDDAHPLTVIRAENETGKTTILTGLQWVLFGDDALPHPAAQYRLHPIDWDRSNSATVDIEVELEFEHTYPPPVSAPGTPPMTEIFIAKRTVQEDLTTTSTWVRRKPEFQLLKRTPNGFVPVPGASGSLQLQQMLGSNLKDLFFTDGDRALSFITADMSQGEKRRLVQQAIRDMLGFDLLEAARKHTEKAAVTIRQQAGGTSSADVDAVANRIADAGNKLEQARTEKDKAEADSQSLAVQISTLDQKIEAALQQGDKEALARDLKQLASRLTAARDGLAKIKGRHADAFQSRRLAFELSQNAVASAATILDDLKKRGRLPRTTVPILRERLDMGSCICGTPLTPGSDAYIFMERTIAEQETASWLDDRLTTLRIKAHETLEELAGPPGWRSELTAVLAERTRIEKEIVSLEHQHKELNVRLDQIPDTDLALLRRQKSDCLSLKEAAIRKSSLAAANIELYTKQKRDGEVEYDRLARQNSALDRVQKRLAATQDIVAVLRGTYDAIEQRELPTVSSAMEGYFLAMIGADAQAAIIRKAHVNEHFDIVVLGPEGRVLDPDRDLNGASRRALTLAFILALTEVSDVKAPNVIDTPLGMMSPQIKRSVIGVAASHCDQLILFLTRSEIRDIEDLIDKYAGMIVTLTNSNHYPRFLKNDPGRGGARTLRCDCTHHQYCATCERVGDDARGELSPRV